MRRKGLQQEGKPAAASKLTLEKLRREPQFIDLVFAAKTDRTKMEEEPVENVPSTEQPDDFIVVSSGMEGEGFYNEAGEAGCSISSRETSSSIEASSSIETSSPSKPSSPKDSKAKRSRRSPMYRKDEAAAEAAPAKTEAAAKTEAEAPVSSGLTPADLDLSDEDFDLSHISARAQSREEIIAAAEAAAFGEE